MQNKPNFQKSQMNVSNIITRNYKIFLPLAGQKNKPNSNPIKPNLKKAKMNLSYVKTTNYEQKTMNYANNKQTQFSKRPKMNVNLYILKDYENKRRRRLKQNKPKQSQFQTGLFFCKDIYWLLGHILSKNSSLAGYSLSSLNSEFMASRVP